MESYDISHIVTSYLTGSYSTLYEGYQFFLNYPIIIAISILTYLVFINTKHTKRSIKQSTKSTKQPLRKDNVNRNTNSLGLLIKDLEKDNNELLNKNQEYEQALLDFLEEKDELIRKLTYELEDNRDLNNINERRIKELECICKLNSESENELNDEISQLEDKLLQEKEIIKELNKTYSRKIEEYETIIFSDVKIEILREALEKMTMSQLKSRTTKKDIEYVVNSYKTLDLTKNKSLYIISLLYTLCRLSKEADDNSIEFVKKHIIVDSQKYIDDYMDKSKIEWNYLTKHYLKYNNVPL